MVRRSEVNAREEARRIFSLDNQSHRSVFLTARGQRPQRARSWTPGGRYSCIASLHEGASGRREGRRGNERGKGVNGTIISGHTWHDVCRVQSRPWISSCRSLLSLWTWHSVSSLVELCQLNYFFFVKKLFVAFLVTHCGNVVDIFYRMTDFLISH